MDFQTLNFYGVHGSILLYGILDDKIDTTDLVFRPLWLDISK